MFSTASLCIIHSGTEYFTRCLVYDQQKLCCSLNILILIPQHSSSLAIAVVEDNTFLEEDDSVSGVGVEAEGADYALITHT